MNDFISSGITSQERALNVLSQFYNSNRIPHALLFSGPVGVGKHLAAQNFLKLLNSKLPEPKKSKVFAQISNFEEPSIKFVMPLPRGSNEKNNDNPLDKLSAEQIKDISSEIKKKAKDTYYQINVPKANIIKINSIRDIKKFTTLYSGGNDYKGVIISDAHLMPAESQNALLKNLEEPPDRVIFILITHQPGRLLETIHSRSWKVDFQPLDEESIQKILIKNYNMEPGEARILSLFAYGSVSNALALGKTDLQKTLDSVITILRYSLARHYATALRELNEAVRGEAKSYLLVLKIILYWLSDASSQKILGEVRYFVKHKETLEKFNKRFKGVNIAPTIDKINTYMLYQDKNIYLNVLLLNVIFDIAKITF